MNSAASRLSRLISTPTLTLGRYAHIQLIDQTQALDALPAIEPSDAARHPGRATGTGPV